MDKYIRFEDAINAIKELPDSPNGFSDTYDKAHIIAELEDVPTADVVPVRHGRWLIKTVRGDKRTVCSECLIETGTCYEDNYCPNCGALMDKDGDEE